MWISRFFIGITRSQFEARIEGAGGFDFVLANLWGKVK